MARKKTPHAKTSSEAKRKPAPEKAASAYSQMAQRSLDLWREQLNAIGRSPAAMQEMSKMMQPVFSLFTQGMDMWLMMTDPFSRAGASPFGGASGSYDTQASPQTAPKKTASGKAPAGKKRGTAAKKPTPAAAAPAAFDPLAGASAMAELARRVAAMERQQAGSKSVAPSARAGSGKAATVIGFEEASSIRSLRRTKA